MYLTNVDFAELYKDMGFFFNFLLLREDILTVNERNTQAERVGMYIVNVKFCRTGLRFVFGFEFDVLFHG